MVSHIAGNAAPADGFKKFGDELKDVVHRLDEYTRPRPGTGGDFEHHDYLQPMFHAAGAGYAFMGLPGVGVMSAASLAATFTVRKTDSRILGAMAGAVTGAATAAAIAGFSGAPTLGLVIGGALLGGLQSMRGDRESCVRDASGGATMVTGLFLPGTLKVAGAVGAGAGAAFKSPAAKLAVGAAVGGLLGAGMAAIGLAPGGFMVTTALSALGGGIGPFLGPRFSQFFRNLANDAGRGVNHLLEKAGVDSVSESTANSIGAFPAQFAKEGIRGFINSDFQLSGLLVGGVTEAIELIHIFKNQKHDDGHAPPSTGQNQPQPPTAHQHAGHQHAA